MNTAIKFVGGVATTENLTGSCTAMEIKLGKRTTVFLVDAGLVQGDNKNFFKNNNRILENVDPKKVDYVIVTHAHIDHVGLLPLLVSKGFRGRIMCTQATADLMPIMLDDSYKVQKEMAAKRLRRDKAHAGFNPNKKKPQPKRRFGRDGTGRKKEALQLFEYKDVEKTIGLIYRADFGSDHSVKLSKGITLRFVPSGHILGGAVCVIEVTNPRDNSRSRLAFSGDLGRQDGLLLFPPEKLDKPVDFYFTESTYGAKNHPKRAGEISKLFQMISDAKEQGKKVIIPSFALQRSQELIHLLSAAMERGEIPQLPIYLDSPMAIKITGVFAKYWDINSFSNKYALKFNPFCENTNQFLKFVNEPEDSIRLAHETGPLIVIASSGMCDAGRIRDHLRFNLSNDKAIICLVGFMAPTSLGAKLQNKPLYIKMNEDTILIKAEIVHFESFSAHADSDELADYAASAIGDNKAAQMIFILHGEQEGGIALQQKLQGEFHDRNINISLPEIGDYVELDL